MDEQAIADYVQAWDGVFQTKKKRELAERARKQLLAMGWTLWFTPKGERQEARYDSPAKKTFASLLTACRAVPLQRFSKKEIKQESKNLKRKRSNLLHNRHPTSLIKENCSPLRNLKKRKESSCLGKNTSQVLRSSKRTRKVTSDNDDICSVCHNDGELVLCDGCPASFHSNCLNLPNVPDGDWFCPSCRCAICDSSDNQTTHNCDQCKRLFHVSCLRYIGEDECPKGKWFCSTACDKIYRGLEKLQRKTIPLDHDDLTWTLVKPSTYESGAESHNKLSLALEVMHECFEPVKEPLTGRDLVEDVIFGTRSKLKRLNFTGFYTLLLEKNNELATAATVRIYGEKVAEVPLVATRFKFRRQGMCSFLMNVLEKMLTDLGVERLVLPAVPTVLDTWTALGFSAMTPSERSEFLGYTFLDFPRTIMCHKLLKKPVEELHHKSPILGIPKDNDNNGCKDPSSDVMEITSSNQQDSTIESKPEAREIKDDRVMCGNPYKFKGEVKQYSRRKAVCKSSVCKSSVSCK